MRVVRNPGWRRAPGRCWRAWSAPTDASFWKLSRARYYSVARAPRTPRRLGAHRAARTSTRCSCPAEGHFWLAANMGALAESFGMSQGLKYRKPIKAALEEVLRLDPAYASGSADRALGRWYFKVPGLFGGSNAKSEQHLRKSLTYDAQSTASWFFLAETLEDLGRKAEARAALQKVLDAPLNPEWAPEDRRWKELARARLAQGAR